MAWRKNLAAPVPLALNPHYDPEYDKEKRSVGNI
jgi:hypothetical protein